MARLGSPGALGAALLTAVLAAACSQPLHVETLQLGRSLNADNSVAEPTTTFKPNETVYVSALNAERGDGTIRVKWYYGTQLLSDREKQVSFKGAGATEFNLQSAGNFPPGDYSVEVEVNGAPVGKRNFTIAN
jgi:TRAP-type C4-dicarboxylate transport system substrate-binding protein